MSNRNIINATAAAISVMEEALAAARLEHASLSTDPIEAKMAAFSEVVRNTRRKMARPAGFEWALYSSFSVVAITETHLRVEVVKGRGGERVVLDVPRGDLSLSTWQVTGIIRRLSAERLLTDLNGTVTEKKKVVATDRKAVAAAEEALRKSEQVLAEASAAVDRRLARVRKVEAKREAARARRKAAAGTVSEDALALTVT